MANYYLEMLSVLAKEKVKFVVAGGVACVLHGVERMTMDLDLAVEFNQENLKNFINAASNLNLKPRVPVPLDFILDAKNRKIMIEEKNALVFSLVDPDIPMKHIDIFLTEDNSYQNLSKDCDTIKIAGFDIKVASIDKIIEMKKRVTTFRAKDSFDISELEKIKNNK